MSTVRRLSRARCIQSGVAVLGLSLALTSALPPAPAAAATEVRWLKVLSSTSFTEKGIVYVAGQLVNQTGYTVDRVAVTLDLRDAKDQSIGVEMVDAQTSTLDDGELTGFSIAFPAPQKYHHLFTGGVEALQSPQPANHNFAITVARHYAGTSGEDHLVGTVKNLNTAEASEVTVDATYFDKDKKAIGAEQVDLLAENGSPTLAAGETVPFDVVYEGQTGAPAPASYVLIADSLDDPSPLPTSWVSSGGGARTYGQSAPIAGRITKRGTNKAPGVVSVELLAKTAGSTAWQVVLTGKTSADGKVAFSPKPVRNTSYAIRLPASASQQGSQSASLAVVVNALNTAKLSTASMALGRTASLTATVAPSQAGRIVTLQQLVSGKWTNVTSHALDGKSSWVFSVKPTARGTYTYRTSSAAYAANGAGTSAQVSLKVT